MGAKFTSLITSPAPLTQPSLKCAKDSDCYGEYTLASTTIAAATTDAEKAKRCCAYTELTKAPSGANQAVGDAVLLAASLITGVAYKTGEYTKSCSLDYPSTMKSYTTGAFISTPALGDYEFRYYCDGGAAKLAVATAASVSITLTCM